MIDTTDKKNEQQRQSAGADHSDEQKSFLSAQDRDFIQKYCIDAIRLKKLDKVPTKSAKAAPKLEDENAAIID